MVVEKGLPEAEAEERVHNNWAQIMRLLKEVERLWEENREMIRVGKAQPRKLSVKAQEIFRYAFHTQRFEMGLETFLPYAMTQGGLQKFWLDPIEKKPEPPVKEVKHVAGKRSY